MKKGAAARNSRCRRVVGLALCAALTLSACKKSEVPTEVLLKQLETGDLSVRAAAAEQLLRRDHPRGLDYFHKKFIDGEAGDKAHAARLLGQKPHPKSLALLLGALHLGSAVAAESLAFHLKSAGGPAESVQVLLQKVGGHQDRDSDRLNESILFALGEFKQDLVLPYLVAALSSGSFAVRRAAGIALAKRGSAALPILDREFHRAGNHSMHGPAVLMEAVGSFKDPKAAALLLDGLVAGDVQTRKNAGDGLIKLGDAGKLKVEQAQKSDNEILRQQAKQLLGRWGNGSNG